MRNSFTRLAALLVMALFVTAQNTAPTKCRVVDPNGAVVADAHISISRANDRQSLDIMTNGDGAFDLGGVADGNYVVVVRAKGFATLTTEIELPTDRMIEIVIQPGQVAADVLVTSSYLAGSRDSLFDVPGSIDRIDRAMLDTARVFNFSEALRKIPGVNVRDEEGFGLRPNIGIRGTNPTRSAKVLLLEDGTPLTFAPYGDNASYYHPPIERYESIEVMKGSSQIAYGPQTIAGVINYITPNPTKRPSFSAALTGGSGSYLNASFSGSGTINKTGIWGAFTRKQGKGARENIESKLNDVVAKVVHTINDRNALTFKFSYYGEDSMVTYSGLTQAEYLENPRLNPFQNDRFYGDRTGFSISHAAVLTANASLTTNAYYNRFDRDWWRQSSNSGQRPNRLNVDPDCRSMADLNTTCGNEGRLRNYKTYGIEQRFALSYGGHKFGGELQSGYRLHREEQFRRQFNGSLPTSRDGVASEINERGNVGRSVYVQNRFILGDLAITPGLRFENIAVTRRNLLPAVPQSGETSVNALIPGVGFAYSGLPRMTVFAGVHRGFSPPRAEDIIGNNGGVVELEPEKSWNYELGVRTSPIDGLIFEVAGFSLDYENQIVPASLAGGVGSLLTNGGRTLQQGVEGSATVDSGRIFRSRHSFYLRSAFTWLPTAEFRGVRFSSSAPTVLITGNRLPYVPEKLITSSFGYSHTRGINTFVENVLISDQFSDDLNSIDVSANGQRGRIAGQSYWNATTSYFVESMRSTFFVSAKNLTGRTFVIDRSRGILPSMGRHIQAGVKIKF
jgi:Fe(3+) dicitrate transport protein